jgi:hypothetical protein
VPSVTKITCDCGCKKEIELGEAYVTGAEKLLQVKDARGVSYWFLSTDCLRAWLKKYVPLAAPDLNEGTEEPVPDEAMPEFEN